MSKTEQLSRAKEMLAKAAFVASEAMPNDGDVADARRLIVRAIEKLDEAAQTRSKRKTESAAQTEKVWGSAVAKSRQAPVAQSHLAVEAQQRALSQINSMIDEEKKYLEQLEQESARKLEQSKDFDLLD